MEIERGGLGVRKSTGMAVSSFLAIFSLLAPFSTTHMIGALEPGRVNCREKIVDFHDCVNKTISQKHTPGSKFQLVKMRVNECLQKNRCAKMFILESRIGDQEEENVGSSPIQESFHLVHQCIHDLKEQSMPLVQKCVDEIVPNAPIVKHAETRWKLIQEAMNRTLVQRLCAHNGSMTGAFTCIDRLFSPNSQARQRQEKRFKEFCTAARQCQVGMGVCRTDLDNGRKAICDCMSRLFEDYNNIKPGVPSCANVTSDMIKASRRIHPPFMDDNCGPDPCDSSFQHLTNAFNKDANENVPDADNGP